MNKQESNKKMFRQSVKKLIERSTQTTSTKTNVFNTNSKRKMSGGGSIEEEIGTRTFYESIFSLFLRRDMKRLRDQSSSKRKKNRNQVKK